MIARHNTCCAACGSQAGRAARTHVVWRLLVLALLLAAAAPVRAGPAAPELPTSPKGEGPTALPGRPDELLEAAGFDQKLNAQVPAELEFRDETGSAVRLGDYLGSKPVILALAYYECPNLCGVLLNDLVDKLRSVPLNIGRQFEVVTVSIDPREQPAIAAAKKQGYLERYGRSGAAEGWHFLTGKQAQIVSLAQAVGFRYAYDPVQQQYAHPSGLLVLTPAGKIAGYLYGLQYEASDLRLSLVQASANKIGTPIDAVLLRCFRYDPTTGTYELAIMNVIRLLMLATLLMVVAFLAVMLRRERRVKGAVRGPEPQARS